jgi:hypothetical protein
MKEETKKKIFIFFSDNLMVFDTRNDPLVAVVVLLACINACFLPTRRGSPRTVSIFVSLFYIQNREIEKKTSNTAQFFKIICFNEFFKQKRNTSFIYEHINEMCSRSASKRSKSDRLFWDVRDGNV